MTDDDTTQDPPEDESDDPFANVIQDIEDDTDGNAEGDTDGGDEVGHADRSTADEVDDTGPTASDAGPTVDREASGEAGFHWGNDESDGPPTSDEPKSPADAAGDTDGARQREGPLGDIASQVDRRRERRGEREDLDELFQRQDVGEVDSDTLWEQIEGESIDAGEGDTVEAPHDRTVRTVEKRSYCQKCRHFSPPPDVHCTNEGTDILEMPDIDHFRVADCPVVAEDERLEELGVTEGDDA